MTIYVRYVSKNVTRLFCVLSVLALTVADSSYPIRFVVIVFVISLPDT
jgi:hypothetical protein